jgi:hypothetical protein
LESAIRRNSTLWLNYLCALTAELAVRDALALDERSVARELEAFLDRRDAAGEDGAAEGSGMSPIDVTVFVALWLRFPDVRDRAHAITANTREPHAVRDAIQLFVRDALAAPHEDSDHELRAVLAAAAVEEVVKADRLRALLRSHVRAAAAEAPGGAAAPACPIVAGLALACLDTVDWDRVVDEFDRERRAEEDPDRP